MGHGEAVLWTEQQIGSGHGIRRRLRLGDAPDQGSPWLQLPVPAPELDGELGRGRLGVTARTGARHAQALVEPGTGDGDGVVRAGIADVVTHRRML